MNMGMGMGFQLQIVQVLQCGVCRQEMNEDKRRSDMITSALFGHAAYAVCCVCNQEVKNHKDRNYRVRFRRMRKKQQVQAKCFDCDGKGKIAVSCPDAHSIDPEHRCPSFGRHWRNCHCNTNGQQEHA